MSGDTTVAGYLKTRLEQLGLDRMFGVAGNYTAALLDTILTDASSPIAISSDPNELCAGFAADAYARYRGIGAVYVTYSVGAFTLLNTTAGSYTERAPVLVINGGPTNKEVSIEQNAALLYSHTTGYDQVDINVFRPVTVAAERITDARRAPFQIDSVLTAMLTEHRPGYLEVTEDVWRAACAPPDGQLSSGAGAYVTRSETDAAVRATMALLERRPRLVLWAGTELQRYGLVDEFLELLDAINAGHEDHDDRVRFVTTASSKSVVAEDHPLFEGCVTLRRAEIEQLVGDDGVLLGLGGWTTSKDTGSENIRGPGTILATGGNVVIGAGLAPLVDLRSYLAGLTAAFADGGGRDAHDGAPSAPQPQRLRLPEAVAATARLATPATATASGEQGTEPGVRYDEFFAALDEWLGPDDILVVDAGFPLIGAQRVGIDVRDGFVAQAAWLSIGYSVPAATGVKAANPDKRVIVVVGDGAFQETCQAVSDHTRHGHDTVVFVLANGLYGIEQFLVNPNPFRTPPEDHPDPLQNAPYPYNELPAWDLVSLAEGFGAVGRTVGSVDELGRTLAEVRDLPDRNLVVEVQVPRDDIPSALVAAAAHPGEDETDHRGWPPASTF